MCFFSWEKTGLSSLMGDQVSFVGFTMITWHKLVLTVSNYHPNSQLIESSFCSISDKYHRYSLLSSPMFIVYFPIDIYIYMIWYYLNKPYYWLVVDLPLRKIWVRQLGLLLIITPNTWKIIHDVPKKEMFQKKRWSRCSQKYVPQLLLPPSSIMNVLRLSKKEMINLGPWDDQIADSLGFATIRRALFLPLPPCNVWDLWYAIYGI